MPNGYSFNEELQKWGPEALDSFGARDVDLEEAEAYCRELARRHYENFPVVSWLLPRSKRQHFSNVYAYCRWADDLADECDGTEQSLELLSWWRNELTECYAGNVRHPVFVALTGTIKECSISIEPFEDLISAFEQDQRLHEYETFDALLDYCCRSANPVGRLLLAVCGQYNEQNVVHSDSICTGLQLANFWQDVARDDEIGRVYLPLEDRERFGYTQADLKARITNEAFLKLMRFEVERARDFLLAGLPLVKALPGRLQVDIELFARGGLSILDSIEAIEYRVWEQRPTVTRGTLARLFLMTCVRSVARQSASLCGFTRSKLLDTTENHSAKKLET